MSSGSAKFQIPQFSFHGSPRSMGESFGETCRDEIHALCEIRVKAALDSALLRSNRVWKVEEVLAFAKRCLPLFEAFDPDGFAELTGISHGAVIAPEQLYAMQGLTDIRDSLAFSADPDGEGCSSFVLGGERTESGRTMIGQTWDLHTNNLEFVCLVRRRPSNAPETISLTLSGCPTLIGMNEHGIAIGTTNLHTHDAQVGVHYLDILHRAVSCRRLDEASRVIREAPRMAAHYYMLADGIGGACGLECSARRVHEFGLVDGMMVHCNHALAPAISELESLTLKESTCNRQGRMEELLLSHPALIGLADLREMLGDHEGGELAICRHQEQADGVSTNACVIMEPGAGRFHACRGQAHVGEWVTICF